jgi:hypothetical protein
LFWPKKKDKTGANKNNLNQLGQGLILFDTVEEAIQAEKLVKKAGYTCALVAPPPPLGPVIA